MENTAYNDLTLVQLRQKAKEFNIPNVSKAKKQDLIDLLIREEEKRKPHREPAKTGRRQNNDRYAKVREDIQDAVELEGPLEILPEGFGIVRREGASPEDR